MAKNTFVKVEIFLTPENAKLLKQVNTIIYTPHLYINAAIEATANMKKFKDMRDEDTPKNSSTKDEKITEKNAPEGE